MYKYVLMFGRDDAAVLVDADDNKTVKEYINKGYGIMNRVRAKNPIKVKGIKVIKNDRRHEAERSQTK